mmetsp:Transcript_17401/g.39257  ORF Transcript_17401/g.39257 Transcript_17401/m.39257 type:complete len:312 (-) Transcript_17401:171-1106(-)
MPYPGNIEKLPTAYLPDAIKEGCCAAVWRYVTAMSGENDKAANLQPNQEVARVISRPLGPYNETMLHLAVQAAIDGNDPAGQVCRALLIYKADPRAKTSKRDLPLHKAAGAGLSNIYDILVEAHAQVSGDVAAKEVVEAQNEFGQAPKEMLENSIIYQGLRREQALTHDAEVLLRVGFTAFQNTRMVAKLRAWRCEQAIHLFEVLHKRWPFFAGSNSLEHFESESSSSGAESGADESMSPERSTMSRSRNRKKGAISRSPVKQVAGDAADRQSQGWSNPNLKKVQFAIKMRNLRSNFGGAAKPDDVGVAAS